MFFRKDTGPSKSPKEDWDRVDATPIVAPLSWAIINVNNLLAWLPIDNGGSSIGSMHDCQEK